MSLPPCHFRYAHCYDYMSVLFQSMFLSRVSTTSLVLCNLTQTQSWWTWQSVESNEASHFVVNWWGSCDMHIGQKANSSIHNGTNTRTSFSHSIFYSLDFIICHNFRNWQPRELQTAYIYHVMQFHKSKDKNSLLLGGKIFILRL
jgi:hypothetical protein